MRGRVVYCSLIPFIDFEYYMATIYFSHKVISLNMCKELEAEIEFKLVDV